MELLLRTEVAGGALLAGDQFGKGTVKSLLVRVAELVALLTSDSA